MIEDTLIVGLQSLGASLGLALGAEGFSRSRTGYDIDNERVRAARKSGAVERQAINLERAAQQADLILLAVPAGDAQRYLEVIVPRLKAGALLLDLASRKSESSRWIASNLPEASAYIGAALAVNPELLHAGAAAGAPRADLFRGGLLALAIPPRTPGPAVDLALRLAQHLGAAPFFLDPGEIDAVLATVEDLPTLLGAALVRVAVGTPSWREARRLAGGPFAALAAAGAVTPAKQQQAALFLNRLNVLDRLDALIDELQVLRRMIGDEALQEELAARLDEAIEAHGLWLTARTRAEWAEEERGRVELPERGAMVDRLLGLGQTLRPKDRR